MPNGSFSLRNTLCKLYAYHVGLVTELKRVVHDESERRFPSNPLEELRPDVELARHQLEVQTEESFLAERREAGLPVEESEAWRHAVMFVAEHLPGIVDVQDWLARYCQLRLSQSGSEDERWQWLTAGSLRLSQYRGHTDRDRLRRRKLLAKERRTIETTLQGQPDYRELASGLRELDEHGKGHELLREVWARFPKEAEDARLPPAPPSESGGQGGAGAGNGDEWILAQAARETGVPSWVWSRAAARPADKTGHLPTRRAGNNVYVTPENAKAFARDYDARREQRNVGSKSKDGRNSVAVVEETKKTSKRSSERKSQ